MVSLHIKCRALLLLLLLLSCFAVAEPWLVSSKNFNESYILAEIVAQILERQDQVVQRKYGLGGTLICFTALRNKEIDVYIEYTGTLSRSILKANAQLSWQQLQQRLASEYGLRMLPAIGFNNTYAIVLRREMGQRLKLSKISDLVAHSGLQFAFSHEFLDREDGWPGLSRAYNLKAVPRGIEHGLAYRALTSKGIDISDAYSTDGNIVANDLMILEDDLKFFPEYLAVPLVRIEDVAKMQGWLRQLDNSIGAERMQALNARVVVDRADFSEVAVEFLGVADASADTDTGADLSWLFAEYKDLPRHTLRHLQLTTLAILLACLVGIPLGVIVHRSNRLTTAVLYIVGLLQTIPSIALLALLIPLLGIGFIPALTALFLYSLLPILRNTVLGLRSTREPLIRVARAMGMKNWQQVWYLKLPLAFPAILAGVRTASVIAIGTATLAAFIGAGGLGEPIVTGLALNDVGLILQGAIPAAILAIVVELLFEGIEKLLIPKHLRMADTTEN